MSDGALSQDEIDALMSGSTSGDMGSGGFESSSGGDDLTESEKQAFLTIVNGIIGAQSATLSGMTGQTVSISPPSIEVVDGESIPMQFETDFVRVKASFTEGATGYHSYLFSEEVAKQLAGLLTGLEQVELDDAALSAVNEAVNTILGSTITVLSDKMGSSIMPEPSAADLFNTVNSDVPGGKIVKLNYPITIDGFPQAVFNELYDLSIVKSIVPSSSNDIGAAGGGAGFNSGNDINFGASMPQQSAAAMGGMGAAPNMNTNLNNLSGMMGVPAGSFVNIQNVQYPTLNQSQMSGEQGNIGLLMDVNMEMTVELGRTKKPIRDILSMGEGTIIELDKLAGEPVDILVNHKLIANGEVVVIDENFGVRVTKIVSTATGLGEIS